MHPEKAVSIFLVIVTPVPGINLYIRATEKDTQQYQPVVKTLYRSQIEVKVLDKFEAYELTHRCGGVYFNFCYEEE